MTTPITGDGGHLMYQSGIFSGGRLPPAPVRTSHVEEPPAPSRSSATATCWWSAAAIRHRRHRRGASGRDVILLERHNHLGGCPPAAWSSGSTA